MPAMSPNEAVAAEESTQSGHAPTATTPATTTKPRGGKRGKKESRASEDSAPAMAAMPTPAAEVEPKPVVETDAAGSVLTAAEAAPIIDEQLMGSIEAVLLSIDRPVSGLRLAEALGLLSEEEADRRADEGEEDDDPANPAAPPTGKKKGGKAPAGPTPTQLVRQAIAELNKQYQDTGRAFRIEAVAGGYRFMTSAKFASAVEKFLGKRERTSLSRPAVETLAIIAYKQPMTRAKLEAIRGVACGEVLRTLVERRLVAITGRAEELGRPMLYGTTKQFLEAFGLAGIKDLPSVEEFKARHASDE